MSHGWQHRPSSSRRKDVNKDRRYKCSIYTAAPRFIPGLRNNCEEPVLHVGIYRLCLCGFSFSSSHTARLRLPLPRVTLTRGMPNCNLLFYQKSPIHRFAGMNQLASYLTFNFAPLIRQFGRLRNDVIMEL